MNGLVPVLVALTLAVLGLSYLLQTDRWLAFTRSAMDAPQHFFPAALVMVATGAAIGCGYDNWNGTWTIFVTLLGWLLALEGAVLLVAPGLIQKFRFLSDRFLRLYLRFGGLVLIVLGGLLARALANGLNTVR